MTPETPNSAGSLPQSAAERRQRAVKGHGAKSDAVRERAILALLTERTIERAAKRAGIAERTLRQWLSNDSGFKGAYGEARQAAFQAGMSRIASMVGRAVDTLEELLAAKKHPAVRLGAARTVVEIGTHQHDAETILKKLDEIEGAQRKLRDSAGRR